MAYYPATPFVQQFFNDDGAPLSGGKLIAYLRGTSTLTPLYADTAGTSLGSTVTLNARGEPQTSGGATVIIHLDSEVDYKFELQNASMSQKWSLDSVISGGSLRTQADVASIAALKALSKLVYSYAFVAGYYAAGDGGGGFFYYDASDTTSSENGGTIFVATDGARWKRVYSGVINVKWFGAKGDGTTDDTTASQAAIDAGNVTDFGDSSNTYKITAPLDLSDGDKYLVAQGAIIDMQSIPSGTYRGIGALGSIGSSTAISSGASKGSFTVNVASTSGIVAGDFIQIASGDYYPYGGGSYNVARGEIVKVRSVVANTSITFTTPLLDTYTTSPVVYRINFVNNIHIDGLKIQGSNTPARGEFGISLQYVNKFSVRNCWLDGQDFYQIEVSSCVSGDIENNDVRSAFYNGSTGTIFYGIAIIDSSQWVNVRNNRGDRARHLVVTSARSTGQGFFGQPRHIGIYGNHCYDAMSGGSGRSYAYEIHGFGQFIDLSNNTADGCYSGARIEGGSDINVGGNIFSNYAAYGILIGGASTLLKNINVHDNIVRTLTGEISGGAAIFVAATGGAIYNLSVTDNALDETFNSTAGTGYGIYCSANTYINTSFRGNTIDAGAADANWYAIATQAGADGIEFADNRAYRYREGIRIPSDDCVIKNNLIEHTAAQATGFGLYSNGERNIFQGNTCRLMNTAYRADTSSVDNLFINNQAVSCTTSAISDAGTTNTARDNDAI